MPGEDKKAAAPQRGPKPLREAHWLEEYVEQWTAFPAAPHDDMVDSSTQALSYLLFAGGAVTAVPERMTLADGEALFDVYG